MHSLAQLLNTETTLFYREWVGKDGQPINQINLDSKAGREKFEKEKKQKQKDSGAEEKKSSKKKTSKKNKTKNSNPS